MAPRDVTQYWPVGTQEEHERTHQFKRTLSSPKVVMRTKKVLTKHAEKIAEQADKHEQFLNKVTYCLGVLAFGTFCYLLGSRPQDIPSLYCLFFVTVAPLRWIYYRIKKWHYYLLDFCYYANAIFVTMLLFFPNNEKLFMVCFSFSEGPLAWALIIWRCSLVFSSIDKIVSVLIHLLPGTVFFILRWWDPSTFPRHSAEDTGPWPAWPVVNSVPALWTWLFFVPLLVYCVWQALYFLVVEGLRRQRLLNDPQIMTSYRELKRKAERANNIWWRLSGLLGAEKRVIMYAIIQAIFTVAALALTVPMFKSYRLHIVFEVFKLSATVWNGGNFVFEVMPRQVVAKKKMDKTEPMKDVDGGKETRNLARHKDSGMIVTSLTSTGSKDVSFLANSVVDGLRLEDEDTCALCRRPSAENLAEPLLRLDRLGSMGKHDRGKEPTQNATDLRFLERRQSACNMAVDSQMSGMDWRGRVACVS